MTPKTLTDPITKARKRRQRLHKERYMLRLDDDRFERLRLQAFVEHRPQIDIIRDSLDLYMAKVDGETARQAAGA